MLRPLGPLSLSLRKNELSLFSSGPHPASCYHDEKKNHLALYILFSLLLFIFFPWVRVLSCVCQRRQAQDSAKPANAHFNDSWTLSQSATSEKPFPAKTEDKREILNTKQRKYKPQILAVAGVILKIDFSLIENSMRVLKMWLMGSGLCNCTYCCKRGMSTSHSSNPSSLSFFLQRVNGECLCSCVD